MMRSSTECSRLKGQAGGPWCARSSGRARLRPQTREYHAYVHEQEERGVDAATARKAFANEHNLPFVNGHIRLPDVRLEYPDAGRP